MSRVYFHSPTREAELKGSERAWMSGLVEDLAVGMLDLDHSTRLDRLLSLVGPGHYVAEHAARVGPGMPLATAYRLGFLNDEPHRTPVMQHRGRRIDTFELTLNTALLLGNEQVRLAARLHGQCELHAWVDGPNRAWLADVMQTGIDTGIFRRGLPYRDDPGSEVKWSDQGWDDVIALLRERDDEPVVTSFSITDQFPNSGPDGYDGDWYDLEATERWRIGMEWLRQSPARLELAPGQELYRFGPGLSILDIFAPDWEERLDRALAREEDR
ncbi:hypothetical protein [Streptomyces sp. 3214.6]|uniref:hypothetical protein n=1 Tax=Streptomyces sp. 3214.6 TaxID=1882757 RepID=UPI00090BB69B|nr:hypothetical protein [Streptomyces sp. 3214.6]SHI67236.1 hypothetical protein SAMN05444521_8197 [Streptomyces sp. 3214.6]